MVRAMKVLSLFNSAVNDGVTSSSNIGTPCFGTTILSCKGISNAPEACVSISQKSNTYEIIHPDDVPSGLTSLAGLSETTDSARTFFFV